MPYVIAQPCVDVKDKACVDECPVHVIELLPHASAARAGG